MLSDDIIGPLCTELADVEHEGACWSEEGEHDADAEHEGACWSDEDELEIDISTYEESDLETDGADQLPLESQPSDSSIPMVSENEDWKQPLYPGAKVTKIDSFGQLEKQGTGNETGMGYRNRKREWKWNRKLNK